MRSAEEIDSEVQDRMMRGKACVNELYEESLRPDSLNWNPVSKSVLASSRADYLDVELCYCSDGGYRAS